MDWQLVKIKVVRGFSITLCEDDRWGYRDPNVKAAEKILRGVVVAPSAI